MCLNLCGVAHWLARMPVVNWFPVRSSVMNPGGDFLLSNMDDDSRRGPPYNCAPSAVSHQCTKRSPKSMKILKIIAVWLQFYDGMHEHPNQDP
jgi:hypothetical protein